MEADCQMINGDQHCSKGVDRLSTLQAILVARMFLSGSWAALMNDDNGFITRADRRVIRSLIRNLIIAAVFVVCALGSQWFWGLLLDPASWLGKSVTLFCQIASGVVAASHVVCGAVVLVQHSIRDTVNHVVRDRWN